MQTLTIEKHMADLQRAQNLSFPPTLVHLHFFSILIFLVSHQSGTAWAQTSQSA